MKIALLRASNTPREWSRTQKILHWLTASLIVVMALLGIYMAEFPPKDWSVGYKLYETHKSIGFLLFFILLWRCFLLIFIGRPTPHVKNNTERRFVHFGHSCIYVLLFAQIIIGVCRTYADPLNLSVSLFGFFTIPDFLSNSAELTASLKLAHRIGAITLGILLTGHITMALYHHYVRRDNTLTRMMRIW